MKALLIAFVLSASAEVFLDGGYTRANAQPDGGFPGIVLDRSGAVCVCSSGPSCKQADGGAAPIGLTLHNANGSGCVVKPCVELAGGPTTWPDACPLPPEPDAGVTMVPHAG